jgi:hypothetical protein
MKQKHQKHFVRLLFVSLFFVSTFFVMPTSVAVAQSSAASETSNFSGLVPCGRNVDPQVDPAGAPCTACHAVLGAKKGFDYLVSIMVVGGIAVIMGMGVLYILSGVNEGLLKTAKGGITSVFMGIVFVLSAWLIVSTVLRFVASDNFVNGGGTFGGISVGDGVYGLTCVPNSQAGTATLAAGGVTAGTGKYAGGVSYAGTGTCKPGAPAGNPCSTQSLSGTCFGGGNVDTWSAICQAESNGNVSIASTTDKCAGDSVSFGLFQINITVHKLQDSSTGETLNCPAAFNGKFTGAGSQCSVKDRALYNKCKAAAARAKTNIQKACELAAPNSRNTGPWGAARRCNIPKTL